MTGFVMVTKFLEIEPTAELFHSLFQIKVSTTRGLFYLSSRGDARFLGKYPTSNKFWKDRYFFLSFPEPWPFPTWWVWEVPPQRKVNIRRRDPDLQVLIDQLNKQEYDLSRLCFCPTLLWHFNLSHTLAKLEDDLAIIMNKRLAEKEVARKRNVSMSRAPPQGTSSNPQSIQPPHSSTTSAQPSEHQAPKSPRTIHPDSARDVIKELIDPSCNLIPKKWQPSALDSSQKKSKTVSSSGDITTPNQTFFLQSPILENYNPRTAAEFLQGLCPARECRPLQQASASELVDNFSLDFSKSFLSTEEFLDVLSDGALQYFHLAFDQAEAQGREKGFTEKFDRDKDLTFATDPEGYIPSAEANRVNLSSPVDFLHHILSQLEADRTSSSATLDPPPSSRDASRAIVTGDTTTLEVLEEASLTVADYDIKDTPHLSLCNCSYVF
ncbi:hypothetical protein DH2020_015528 [Rehmannia glutinosa]|uniref:Uncharacterized protein n=1 Tax=Rehmannia glutinosa TaxID=99300 RepID=A0ABR0WUH6_REHGL